MSYHGLGISFDASASVSSSGASGSVSMTAPGSQSCDPFQGETSSCCAPYGGNKGAPLMRGDTGAFIQKCNAGVQAQRQGWGSQVIIVKSTVEGINLDPVAVRDTEAESLAALAALAQYAKQQEIAAAAGNVFQKFVAPAKTTQLNTKMAQLAAQQRAGGAAAIADANRRYQEAQAAAATDARMNTVSKVAIAAGVVLVGVGVWYATREKALCPTRSFKPQRALVAWPDSDAVPPSPASAPWSRTPTPRAACPPPGPAP